MRYAVIASMLISFGMHPAAARDAALPVFDLAKTCADSKEFGSPSEADLAYKGCLQDETSARATLLRDWASFKPEDKRTCVEEGPDPSYVEMLTCLSLATFPDEQ